VAVETPKRERPERTYLTRDEYHRLRASVGAHPRAFASPTVFLQTGIRGSELCALRLAHADRRLFIRSGKGRKGRVTALGRKGSSALRVWLKRRPPPATTTGFSPPRTSPG
jgi:integrase